MTKSPFIFHGKLLGPARQAEFADEILLYNLKKQLNFELVGFVEERLNTGTFCPTDDGIKDESSKGINIC